MKTAVPCNTVQCPIFTRNPASRDCPVSLEAERGDDIDLVQTTDRTIRQKQNLETIVGLMHKCQDEESGITQSR